MIALFFAGALGYLLGSFPTAYIFVLWKSNVDIRNAGSGNVGTLNSYEVTRSKMIGVAVLLIDLAKGAISVLTAEAIFGNNFAVVAISGIGTVLGHNFPVWLRFKGGRGLAPGAGVMLTIAWQIVALWLICWGIGFALTKRVNVGNTIALLLTLLTLVALPNATLGELIPSYPQPIEFNCFALIFFGIMLVKHIEPVRTYILERRSRPAER